MRPPGRELCPEAIPTLGWTFPERLPEIPRKLSRICAVSEPFRAQCKAPIGLPDWSSIAFSETPCTM